MFQICYRLAAAPKLCNLCFCLVEHICKTSGMYQTNLMLNSSSVTFNRIWCFKRDRMLITTLHLVTIILLLKCEKWARWTTSELAQFLKSSNGKQHMCLRWYLGLSTLRNCNSSKLNALLFDRLDDHRQKPKLPYPSDSESDSWVQDSGPHPQRSILKTPKTM